jgi:hypothetical protein
MRLSFVSFCVFRGSNSRFWVEFTCRVTAEVISSHLFRLCYRCFLLFRLNDGSRFKRHSATPGYLAIYPWTKVHGYLHQVPPRSGSCDFHSSHTRKPVAAQLHSTESSNEPGKLILLVAHQRIASLTRSLL